MDTKKYQLVATLAYEPYFHDDLPTDGAFAEALCEALPKEWYEISEDGYQLLDIVPEPDDLAELKRMNRNQRVTIDGQEVRMRGLEDTVAMQANEIDRLTETIGERQAEISELVATVSKREDRLDYLESHVATYAQGVVGYEQRISELNDERIMLAARLDNAETVPLKVYTGVSNDVLSDIEGIINDGVQGLRYETLDTIDSALDSLERELYERIGAVIPAAEEVDRWGDDEQLTKLETVYERAKGHIESSTGEAEAALNFLNDLGAMLDDIRTERG